MLAPLRVVAAEEGKAKRQEELDAAIRNGKITTKETEIRFKINVFDEKINQCFMQVWKRDMLAQLEAVAAKEGEAKRARLESERQEELDSWAARRREQLERLIEIRPMFERRRAMAEEKLLSAPALGGGAGGDEASADPISSAVIQSLDAKLESIDDLIARLEIEEAEEGHGFVPSDDEYYDDDNEIDYDDYGPENSEHPFENNQTPLDNTTVGEGVGEGKQAGGRGEGGTTSADKGSGETQGRKKSVAAATSNMRRKKKKKGGKPGIIEQLKARESSKQEAGDAAEAKGGDWEGKGAQEEKAPPMSLLDAVAAMILGRYPQDPRASNEEHFEKVAAMHELMKAAWVEEFGRLPPMVKSG